MSEVIRSSGLTKRFGKTRVVDALDLSVRDHSITAFLGPNGAGKTTTIRLVLGLLKADEGSCEVLGHPAGDPRALAQIGALVESPSLYDHLSGLENLEITRLMKDAPRTDLDRVLTLVDMKKDARRPVKEYSLGMRQRLAVALALLGEPRLLILDEPSNGLDPTGIQEMRELVRRLPRETGATVFLSSHILAEVEQIATDVVVIHRGTLRYQGPMSELGAPGHSEYLVRVAETERTLARLSTLGFALRVEGDRLLVRIAESDVPRLVEALVQEQIPLFELSPLRVNLEARFMALLETR